MTWTLGGRPILEATIEIPEQGAWWLDAVTDGEPADGVAILGTKEWAGTIQAIATDGGRSKLRVVGGRGGLETSVPDRWTRGGITAEDVAKRVLALAGEELGTVPTVLLGQWHRVAGTAGEAITSLTESIGLKWRIDAAGLLQIGSPPAEQDIPGTLVSSSQSSRRFAVTDIATEPPGIVDGIAVAHVRGSVSSDGNASVSLWSESLRLPRERKVLGAVYAGRVVAGNPPPGHVDLRVEERWDLSAVRLWAGLPGVTAEVRPGAGVLVMYLGGDPRRPVAMLSPDGDTSLISVSIGDSDTAITLAGGGRTPIREGDILAPITPGATALTIVAPDLSTTPVALRSKVKL